MLAEGRDAGRKCALGSVKTNIGHLEAAAGIAGLIKTALALHHRAIPAEPAFLRAEPPRRLRCPAASSPVQPRALAGAPAGRRIAGVSSFGFGGTNAHLVLEEAPLETEARRGVDNGRERRRGRVPALREIAGRPVGSRPFDPRRSWPTASCDADLRDLAYTAGARRGHHDHRLALVVSSRDEIIEALDSFRRGEPHLSSVQGRRLPGAVPDWSSSSPVRAASGSGAGRALFRREPAFRAAIERCDAILSRHLGWSPAAELMADEPSSRIGEAAADRPVQFILQVALAALWESWGIVPTGSSATVSVKSRRRTSPAT